MSDDKRLERIENKIDGIKDHLSDINVTLASQHESLSTHIKRSDLLEAQMIEMRSQTDSIKGAAKLIKVLAILAGIIETIRTFIH